VLLAPSLPLAQPNPRARIDKLPTHAMRAELTAL
jgi:hypothetical protein